MSVLSSEQLLEIDRQCIWHPYSSSLNPTPVYPVARAEGVHLHLADGRKLIDGMSSWWSTLHGYNHPVLNQAVTDQLQNMAHVMFGGLTHQPAVELCQLLVDITPAPLQRVFLCDSGSVAVEIAIKMALQFWHSQGNTRKTRLLTVRHGYHGDTFGAMATCDPDTGMHHIFNGVLARHLFAEAPPCGFDLAFRDEHIADFQRLLQTHQPEIAAVIIEPIVQGAGGMRFYSPDYLRRVRELCDEFDVLLIADEIATGFGRTGELFACNHAGIAPDIMCLGKALSGGYMTLAATLCTRRVSDGISSGGAGVFMHGPTFMANPLACATALASTRLLLAQDWRGRVQTIAAALTAGLSPLQTEPHVRSVRVLGAIGVVELAQNVNTARVQAAFIEAGVWVRPFGNLIYVMPPFVIDTPALQQLLSAMQQVISRRELFIPGPEQPGMV